MTDADRIIRIRRCRKLAQRIGLDGLAKTIDAANAALFTDNRPGSDALIRVAVADIRFMRAWSQRECARKQAAE
jgi:hypothetical protein